MARREATISLAAEQWRVVDERADRLGMTTEAFIRSAVLHFTIDPVPKRPSAGQLNRIYKQADSQGHVWTEGELREQHLPLYWSEEWARARLVEGYNLMGLALLSGFHQRVIGHYLRTHFGISLYKKLDQEAIQEMRTKVAAGESREAVAAEYGLTIQAIIPYCRDLPDGRTNNFLAKASEVRVWPATTKEIADALFDGEGNRASSWCRDMVKSGRLERVGRGLYTLAREQKTVHNE